MHFKCGGKKKKVGLQPRVTQRASINPKPFQKGKPQFMAKLLQRIARCSFLWNKTKKKTDMRSRFICQPQHSLSINELNLFTVSSVPLTQKPKEGQGMKGNNLL